MTDPRLSFYPWGDNHVCEATICVDRSRYRADPRR